MNHRLLICLFAVVALIQSLYADSLERSKPNIILVFIDDMGWGDFSCFGNQDAQTPHIDALAAEGIAFDQFYVNSPICSASRVAISTGNYPARWGITSYLAGRQFNRERVQAQWLDPNAPMLARSLQEAGYATGHFGKWHMGGQRDVSDAYPITNYGFDEALTNFEGLGPKLTSMTMRPDGTVALMHQNMGLGGPEIPTQRYEMTSVYVDAALGFMQKAKAAGKPFYVNVWPDDVHSPFWPPIDQWGDGSKRDRYIGVLEAMDAQLSVLFDAVRKDPELRENTLILVCSDNGPEIGAGSAGPFKGTKYHVYEGGIRSPLVVWGPPFVAASAIGTHNTESVFSAIDLVPSLIDFGDAQNESGIQFDGDNVLDTLLGKGKASRAEPLFFCRPPDENMKSIYGIENAPDLAIRSGQWKLLCDYDGSRPELYNLSTDPQESENLVAEHTELTQSLLEQTLAWWGDVQKDSQVAQAPFQDD